MPRMSSSCKFLLKRKTYQTKVPFFTGRALLLLVRKVICAIFWENPSIGTESPLRLGEGQHLSKLIRNGQQGALSPSLR